MSKMINQDEWNEVKTGLGMWIPQFKDEKIEGTVVEKKEGQWGTQITIKESSGTLSVTPSHKALQSRLSCVKVGDLVRIIYHGAEPPKIKGQQGTRLYSLYIHAPIEEEI
jgi:hypothetical protein